MMHVEKKNFIGCSRDAFFSVGAPVEEALSSNFNEYVVFPGFCDVHVHFREPGFSYKETIATGSRAAAAGGYTSVCTMPNLNPVPDSVSHLEQQLSLIRKQAVIDIYPYGAITVAQKGEQLADMEKMAPSVIAFSDDGRGVQSEDMMRRAMILAKNSDRLIAAHCEDNSLLCGGYIHDGVYAQNHGHKGISSASEYVQIERDLRLAEETGCKYHVCHISTAESVAMIRDAKNRGVDVTCETAPHYLVMDDSFLQEDGRFKMNPPLRDAQDRHALLEGITDGTIDMIATDHAPHSIQEKNRGLSDSAFGVVGLETAFSVLYTHLVKQGVISLEKLVELMSVNPRKRFGIPMGNSFTVWDLNETRTVEPEKFLSKGRATPFEGWVLNGKCIMTLHNGKIVYRA
ncbi:MAG: dihydroorotase [Oscillospiraceae bacterium]|nr:dihydroorotase [Oscillospiraceae bacterium]